jgi:ubiquinone/menaquinone biosynthesis C-methylase UbiE
MEELDPKYLEYLDLSYRNSRHLMYKKMRLVLKHVKSGKLLIDVGCGTGEFLIQLSDHFESLVGIDASSASIEFASKKIKTLKNISLYEGNLQSIHFPDEYFDVCLCLDVLEHVENPLFLLQEIYRILVPGAKIVVTVPNWYDIIISGILRKNHSHINTLPPWTWLKFLRRAGFRISFYRAVDFPILKSDFLAKKFPIFGMCIIITAVK